MSLQRARNGRLGFVLAGLSAFATPALAQTPAQPPLKISVTIKPIHALVLQVMDGVGTASLVVDGNASPHTFSLRPSDAKTLNDADVVFRVSEAVEPFTAKIVKSLPKTVQVVTLAEVPGLMTLPRRTAANFEKHDAGAKGHAGHSGHGHGAKPAPAKAGQAAPIDGHVWLDPENAKIMLGHIASVLTAKRPALGGAFKANAAKAVARLDALANELAAELKPVSGKPYIVFHDAFQYLETRYGLTPVGSISIEPETPPSGKRLNDLRSKVKTLGATCVFSEPGFEARVVQSIIEGTPAKTAALDPEGLTVAKGVDAYDTMMRGLAKALRSCMAPA